MHDNNYRYHSTTCTDTPYRRPGWHTYFYTAHDAFAAKKKWLYLNQVLFVLRN